MLASAARDLDPVGGRGEEDGGDWDGREVRERGALLSRLLRLGRLRLVFAVVVFVVVLGRRRVLGRGDGRGPHLGGVNLGRPLRLAPLAIAAVAGLLAESFLTAFFLALT